MKKAGIIGGLGPETLAKFCLEVGFACSKKTGIRPNILVSNVAIPLRTESEIINGRNKGKILPLLIDSAKQLEKAGADFIVIPCNTVHVFIEEIRKSVKIPVLSIVEEAVTFLNSKGVKKVGLLGTNTTIKEKLFDRQLKQNGIKIVIPDNSNQTKLSLLIDRLVKKLPNKRDKQKLLEIIDRFTAKNVDCVLLACTDLQLLIKNHNKVRIFDTLDILAKATVREIINTTPVSRKAGFELK